MRTFATRPTLQRKVPLNSPSEPGPRLQASRGGAMTVPQVMRKETEKKRDEAPTIDPGAVAKSWLYVDDPTGHVASVYFETFSSDLDEDDNWVLYGVNQLLEDSDPPAKMTFIGHADSTGEPASNEVLSRQRAETVRAWFPLPTAKTAVEVIGHGEQGPESTADNAPVLSHYRRVDVVIEPPRRTIPKRWQGGGSKYASEELKKEMARALDALDKTIGALQHGVAGGVPTTETTLALERYFSHPRYRSPEFMQTLLEEIVHLRAHIDSIHYQEVRGGDIFTHCSTEPYRNVENDWDQDLCVALRGAQRGTDIHAVAFGYPKDNPHTIVLMPAWYGKGDPASILIHEAAHLVLGHRGHPNEVPHRDPYAIQGFVAELGSLQAPASQKKYPP
jgi:outer membrane protein OmpA-like peptidoglycan-associated protein